MDCPACSAPMIVIERQGIELDYCPACRGLWFDADELELLAETYDIDVELPDASRPRRRRKPTKHRAPARAAVKP